MKNLHVKLKKKGWSDEEIRYSLDILSTARTKKSKRIKWIEKMVFWVLLLLVILGSFATSVILFPFLYFMNTGYLYIFIAFIALGFGWIIMKMIQEIDDIEDAQIILPGLFLPVLALINIYVIVSLANMIATGFQYTEGIHNAILISLVYMVSFMIPYIVHRCQFKSPKPL